MEKTMAKIRLDEKHFTELVKGNQVSVEAPSIKVDIILADRLCKDA